MADNAKRQSGMKPYNKKEEKKRDTSKPPHSKGNGANARPNATAPSSKSAPTVVTPKGERASSNLDAVEYRASGVRKRLNPGTLLGPLPAVMVTCGAGERLDVVTVAWTGITSTKPPTLYISLRPERYSHGLISESGEFVVNLVPSTLARACDWCGMYSGRDRDKFAECPTPLELVPSQSVACPTLALSPLALECRVLSVTPLGSHDMFLAAIECMTVDEALLDEKGRLCLERARPLAFHHGVYYAPSERDRVGEFGFAVRSGKRTPKR